MGTSRRSLKSHREVILSESMNVYIDRVAGKRDPIGLDKTREHVKVRIDKLKQIKRDNENHY